MQNIYELITLEFLNEHDLEHDLEHKRKFTEPKIYDANGDLKERWYVYFSFRNPETGKLQRMKNIYGGANRYKTKSERYSILNLYRKRLLKFLNEGYNPFEENTEFHQKRTNESKVVPQNKQQNLNADIANTNIDQQNKTENKPQQEESYSMPIHKAFDKAILLKTNVVSKTTLNDYKTRISQFQKWLSEKHKNITKVNQINKKIVVEFLNGVQLSSSARNRNNYRVVLSSIFQLMEDNELMEKNFIKQIKSIRTKPNRHKTYSLKEQKAIFEFLETNDRLLLLYIKFISYNLLRPIEVCRLKIKDINIEQKTLHFQAKNKILKTKIIPDILFKELPDLTKLNGEFLLFTPNGIGGEWNTALINRRDYFSKRFKSVIKDRFGFNENYSLYSFRHTFITKLYRALKKDSSPYEAKSKLMQITGHTTMTALEKYLRDIDAELPEDYSDLL
ncbi:tyrosine-type recombinase/integrase [Winogradskyella pulchriflava]|uniref:Tyrosine-type recombinase/integrase n=1 Tax=Winogradskyella pulchriflava TaxID=1110688 RepID=A0ABV6Q7L3_9FLAO